MRSRFVIIGVGTAAEFNAKAVEHIQDAALVAASCRTQAKGEKFAAAHACKWYESAGQMLRQERPDVAIICTPSGAHLEAVLECAKQGVHALCEKPLEISMRRLREMDRAVRQAGIQLGSILPMRFSPTVQPLVQAAREGRFGALAGIAVTMPWWREDAYYGGDRWQGTLKLDGGGALMNQGIHLVDLMLWLARMATDNCEPAHVVEEVSAYTGQRGHPGVKLQVEDTAVASIRFRGGAFGQIMGATSMYPGTHRRLLIGGRDGTAEMIEDQLSVFQFRSELQCDKANRAKFGLQTGNISGASDPANVKHHCHQLCIEQFLRAIEKRELPMVTLNDAAESVALIQACYASANFGRPIAPERLSEEPARGSSVPVSE
jgi:predicted dehydrogenase